MEMLWCLSLSFLSRLKIWTHWFGHFEAAECLESSLAGVEAVRSLSVWQAGGMMPENQSLVLLMWCDSLLGHLVEGYSCTATNQWPCTILINIRGSQRPLLQGLRSSCPPDYSSLWFNTNMDTTFGSGEPGMWISFLCRLKQPQKSGKEGQILSYCKPVSLVLTCIRCFFCHLTVT